MTPDRSTDGSAVVGLILHRRGTLRLFRNDRGRLHVEVIGFDTDEGRTFLAQLGAQVEDICAEIMVHEHPDIYGPPFDMPALLHRRREAPGAGAGAGTGAPTAPLGPRP